jgi:2-polyprenyl-3-methyl-5-hydroxy-6-metoxy-1,4-benzoquinol methylase
MHQLSLDNCKKFITKYLDPNQSYKICEVGAEGQGGSYRQALDIRTANWSVTTFDLTTNFDVDVALASPEDWQLAPEHQHAYDVILCGQCLEHVKRPWKFIHQLCELAKPNALLFLTAPNTWDYHAYPIDCWRIWPDGMRALFEDARIIELECFFVSCDTVGIGRMP